MSSPFASRASPSSAGRRSTTSRPSGARPASSTFTARRDFALGTCNGCHGRETGTEFVHIAPRDAGAPSSLSGFLLGIAIADPETGELRTFNDLGRREADLERLACDQVDLAADGPTRAH